MTTPWIASLALAMSLAAPGQAPQPPAPDTPAGPAAGERGPRADFEKLEIDAGEVARGQDLPFTFTVKNSGQAVLKILSAKPG